MKVVSLGISEKGRKSVNIRTRIDPVGDTESGCELGRWPFAESRLGPINSCVLKYFTYARGMQRNE